MTFKTLDDFDFKEKKVLLRVDINSPLKEGVILDNARFTEHALTIKELLKKQAAVVVIAHQGRPGDKDFTDLSQHAVILSKKVGRKVKYVSDVFGETALKEIRKLKPGRVLLLENLRFYSEETSVTKNFEKTMLVQKLSKACEVFVNDAFSVAHRAQTSVVGFPLVMPSYAGRVMQKEFEAASKALTSIENPYVMILGGAKPDDVFKLFKYSLESEKVDKILCSGVFGELCLVARGIDFGLKQSFLMETGEKIIPALKPLLEKYSDKIELPVDFAITDSDGIRVEISERQLPVHSQVKDIGSKTANSFSSFVKNAKTIYYKGAQGAFEEPAFELGTRALLKSVSLSKAFTLVGGGHSVTALKQFGFSEKKFSHVSIAGGALVSMLCGEELPGVSALNG
ncbi:MAG: phosphoglycerate kinase [Candidatus Micrarchaeota archaeon]